VTPPLFARIILHPLQNKISARSKLWRRFGTDIISGIYLKVVYGCPLEPGERIRHEREGKQSEAYPLQSSSTIRDAVG